MRDFDSAQQEINDAASGCERFPIWRCTLYDAVGQARLMSADGGGARRAFLEAIRAAQVSGMDPVRLEQLRRYLDSTHG